MWSPGFECQAGPGEAAVDQVGPVLDLLQLALDDADQAVQVGGGEVGHRPLEQRPDALVCAWSAARSWCMPAARPTAISAKPGRRALKVAGSFERLPGDGG